jgi:Cas10/Cmr2, second palm domain
MSRYTLTIVDTTGIQDYIFGTNNLQQNVGASYLVECATRQWVVDALPDNRNVKDLDSGSPFMDQVIEDGGLRAEVVYAGGGNTVIIFASQELAIAFARRLTRKVLLEAPGLQVVLAHQEFDWESQALGGSGGIVKKAMDAIAARKFDQPPSWPTLGFGVTAACTFTGLPAVDEDQDGRLISAEVKAKVDVEPKAHLRLKQLVPLPEGYDFARDFDDFGRTKGESSYIAVIHTDGNGMGKRIQRIGDKHDSNRKYIQEMRGFSLSIGTAARQALRKTVDKLIESVRVENGKKIIGDEIELRDNQLPFRPIVFGGDDVTVVCDGRLGLSVAAYYLEQFSGMRLKDKEPAHCRAGVAVVKTHYPFARAYALADELCRSAKQYIKQRQEPPFGEESLTALDWHFAVGGLVVRLNEVRKREYTVPSGKLWMRPVRLTSPEKDWRSWQTFTQVVREFRTSEHWTERRNKVKALRDALRAGPDAVKHFRTVYGLDKLPAISQQPDMELQGWQGDRCGYFDAIEAVDFFVPLAGEA